jgi:hypothetical protein
MNTFCLGDCLNVLRDNIPDETLIKFFFEENFPLVITHEQNIYPFNSFVLSC